MVDINKIDSQISTEKKNVSYDTREFTIEIIVKKYTEKLDVEKNELYVPMYQREFVWDEERQSKFIESLMLGLPIPLIFVAEDKDTGRLEIVDGSQRIRTLSAFLNDELTICCLDKLSLLNGIKYSDLPESRQNKFKNLPIRMIVLEENTTEDIRNDIFERINRGSDLLKDMEKRKGIYRGPFNDFIYNVCAKNKKFIAITPLSPFVENRQEHEELILRFFALYDAYPNFKFTNEKMGVARYLDLYLDKMNKEVSNNPDILKEKENLFEKMVNFVTVTFENGFSKGSQKQVSRVYFEAISIGSILAIEENPQLSLTTKEVNEWLKTGELSKIVSGKYKTHSKAKLLERINYVKEHLLGTC